MLILLVRVIFVTLAILIGLTSGQLFYRTTFEGGMPPWFGGAMGFGIAITLIAAENAFRRRFTRSLVAFLIGLGAGLLLAYLMLSVLRLVIQDSNIYNNLDLPIALIVVYLVLVIVLRNADHFRVVVPFVEFRAERADAGAVVLDAAALADGRLIGLVKAGLLPRRLLVHQRVLAASEELAANPDPVQQARGRRELEGLTELRNQPNARVEIDDTEIPNAKSLADVVLHLTRLENGRLLSGERETIGRALAEGVALIDLTVLAAAFSLTVKPGDSLNVRIEKLGEGRNQGVGHLDDGSLVVVNDAAEFIGQQVRCTVLRLHTTSNGRMVFAERDQKAG